MKVALVTTPPSVRSGIGDYTRHLLPYLREHCDVDVFVDHGADEPAWGDRPARLLEELRPREHDQILYQLGNERAHCFMPRLVRALGGTVAQHDWVLFDMALRAWPGLERGGAKGHALALREGGLGQLRVYARNWLERRRQRVTPFAPDDVELQAGTLLAGWHEVEEGGRWTTDAAAFRIPAADVRSLRLDLHVDAGRRVRLCRDEAVVAELSGGANEVELSSVDEPLLVLETEGVCVTAEQRRHGDSRRLASFVQRVVWRDAAGEHELDLSEPSSLPIRPVNLSRDRFLLPLNRSVVRFADAFVVHSRYVRDRILRDRNAHTAVGVVYHGAEERWRDEDRRRVRERLGLPPAWVEGFLVTSFGGVQPHKRIDQALRALALARREREDLFLVLAGNVSSGEFDPVGMARRLGIEHAVRFTGFVPEEEGWRWLHAGDVALNLRGPSSGGTSGGIFQAFSMGRAVVASDAAEQRELPDACVVKVPLGEGEPEAIARVLVELRDDPARRAALEEAARRFVREECHWSLVARRYAELLEGFPRPRSRRRGFVQVAARRAVVPRMRSAS